jgi:transcriptional/translational regulatory protein YebC/TACO1
MFSTYGGNLGEAGCVGWIFDRKGYIEVEKTLADEDTLMNLVIEAGADDFKSEPDSDIYEIITAPADIEKVKKAIKDKNIALISAEISMIPQTLIKLENDNAKSMLKLMDALEEHDDVKNVYANFDISQADMEKLGV